jgi:hypothetical protein
VNGDDAKDLEPGNRDYLPHRVRLPGFVLDEDEDAGLGSVVKQVTSIFGIRTCGGCERRAKMLNRWLVFTGGRRNNHRE